MCIACRLTPSFRPRKTFLVSDRLDVNLLDSQGNSPLSLCLWAGHNHLVPLLVGAGADLNLRDLEGCTLLHQLILRKNSSMALTLIQSGADIDAR